MPKRRPRTSRLPPWLLNKRQRQKRSQPYKIKLPLPEQKQVNITKNGNVIRSVRVLRKSKNFNDRWARQF